MAVASRLEALELLVAKHSERLCSLEVFQRLLESSCRDLHNSHEALSECLLEDGVVDEVVLRGLVSVRRARLVQETALQVGGIALALLHAAGIAASHRFAVASKVHNTSVQAALPALLDIIPPQIAVFGGSDGETSLPAVECYGPAALSWQALPPMRTARSYCGSAAAQGYFYVFGGQVSGRVLSTVERYNTSTGMWDLLPPMPTARDGCAAVACGGRLHVFGGRDGRQILNTVECYTPSDLGTLAMGAWTTMRPMPTGRSYCGAAALGNIIYVVGGYSGRQSLPTAECCPLFDHQWVPLPPMPTARDGCSAATSGGLLYVFGGRNGWQTLPAAEFFDPAFNCWHVLQPLPTARSGCAAAATPGMIYVFGGRDGGERTVPVAESYNIMTQTWQELPPMLSARDGCSAALEWF
mmetsp:Transcript_104643/g.197134  ORF Transcript_104643/g.197134 Transcript_104643/m.197134 type:complete len:412 (+) Transcript_104643:111-1346(+)